MCISLDRPPFFKRNVKLLRMYFIQRSINLVTQTKEKAFERCWSSMYGLRRNNTRSETVCDKRKDNVTEFGPH